MTKRTRGFTLIEGLLGMVIIVLTVLTLYAMIPFAFNGVQRDAQEVQAVAVGQRYLDDERNAKMHNLPMPVATSVPIDGGDAYAGGSAASAGTFAVTLDGCGTVQSSGTYANLYSCEVTLRWTEDSATRTVTVQSYVTK